MACVLDWPQSLLCKIHTSINLSSWNLPESPHSRKVQLSPSAHPGFPTVIVPCFSSWYSQHSELQFHRLSSVWCGELKLITRGRGKLMNRTGDREVNLFRHKDKCLREKIASKAPASITEILFPSKFSQVHWFKWLKTSASTTEILLKAKLRIVRFLISLKVPLSRNAMLFWDRQRAVHFAKCVKAPDLITEMLFPTRLRVSTLFNPTNDSLSMTENLLLSKSRDQSVYIPAKVSFSGKEMLLCKDSWDIWLKTPDCAATEIISSPVLDLCTISKILLLLKLSLFSIFSPQKAPWAMKEMLLFSNLREVHWCNCKKAPTSTVEILLLAKTSSVRDSSPTKASFTIEEIILWSNNRMVHCDMDIKVPGEISCILFALRYRSMRLFMPANVPCFILLILLFLMLKVFRLLSPKNVSLWSSEMQL